jgi:hypothetical protein
VNLAIDRAELVRIINRTSEGCTESTRARLRAVATQTNAVAVGWWHCDGVGCPIRQAGRRTNQAFQQRFDTEMAALFDARYVNDNEIVPFVVTVLDADVAKSENTRGHRG